MTSNNPTSIRFSLLTALVWIGVSAGVIFLLWNVINNISGRYLPLRTPTPDHTQVQQTISAMLVTPGTALPSRATGASTQPPPGLQTLAPATGLPHITSTLTPTQDRKTGTPLAPCDKAAAGNPIDITIPDDSLLSPGQDFVKTWRLVNVGLCTWVSGYSANFFYGDRMGAPDSVPLDVIVLPEHSLEISVEMVAPYSPGTYQGNWKLSNTGGTLFGIGPNGDAPFWVRIIVSQEQTSTPPPTQEATPTIRPSETITVTGTPQGDLSAELSPILGDAIDLDTLTLNGNDADLLYQKDADNYHWLIPHGEATIGIFGTQEPALPDCQSANMSSAPVAIDSLSVGTYLCYSTGEHRFGRALLKAVDPGNFTLTLDLLTWALP